MRTARFLLAAAVVVAAGAFSLAPAAERPDKAKNKRLLHWVKARGAVAGRHCATDPLCDTPYGELVGAFFVNHPWHQKIKLKVEDPKHAAAAGFENGAEITDEIYQFTDSPYSREKLH